MGKKQQVPNQPLGKICSSHPAAQEAPCFSHAISSRRDSYPTTQAVEKITSAPLRVVHWMVTRQLLYNGTSRVVVPGVAGSGRKHGWVVAWDHPPQECPESPIDVGFETFSRSWWIVGWPLVPISNGSRGTGWPPPTRYVNCQNSPLGMSENGVYSQWNSHLIGIIISKTIGFFRGYTTSITKIVIWIHEFLAAFPKKSRSISSTSSPRIAERSTLALAAPSRASERQAWNGSSRWGTKGPARDVSSIDLTWLNHAF